MKFTPEQDAVLSSAGDIKINAVAGSGKTTTLVEYAKRRPPAARILYLAFNRSVRMAAQKKFAENNLPDIDVQTAHSLAFRRVAVQQGYQVSNGFKIHDIVTMLGIGPSGRDSHSPFIVARHAARFAALFCNSDKTKVADVDYCSTIADAHAAAAAKHYYDRILQGTRLFLAKMDRKRLPRPMIFTLKNSSFRARCCRTTSFCLTKGRTPRRSCSTFFCRSGQGKSSSATSTSRSTAGARP